MDVLVRSVFIRLCVISDGRLLCDGILTGAGWLQRPGCSARRRCSAEALLFQDLQQSGIHRLWSFVVGTVTHLREHR